MKDTTKVMLEKESMQNKSTQVMNLEIPSLSTLHPAGTSKDSDKCDLSKDSEIAPLTLESMDNSFFYHLFCFTQES